MSKEEYIQIELNRPYAYADVNHLLENLKNNRRVIFTKFGDGEGACMTYQQGRNGDGDMYTKELGDNLRKAFCILCNMDNTYIGRWHAPCQTFIKFYLDILYDYSLQNNKALTSPPFVDYHFIYPDTHFDKNQNMFNFVKDLQNTNKHKIIVSNSSNKNLSIIFKGDVFIEIPSNSWYAYGLYNQLYNSISSYLKQYADGIVIIAGGLASKVLITNLALEFTEASFLDIGSGFDILAKNKCTRSWNELPDFNNSFDNQVNYFQQLLPDNWLSYTSAE